MFGAGLRWQEPVRSATRELKQKDHTNSRESSLGNLVRFCPKMKSTVQHHTPDVPELEVGRRFKSSKVILHHRDLKVTLGYKRPFLSYK